MNKESKEWAAATLFVGVVLGIVGNLAVNVLDRYFVKYGKIYDVCILFAFISLFLLVERKFTKLVDGK